MYQMNNNFTTMHWNNFKEPYKSSNQLIINNGSGDPKQKKEEKKGEQNEKTINCNRNDRFTTSNG